MRENNKNTNIQSIYGSLMETIALHNFTIREEDLSRPWGGFIRLEDKDAELFLAQYFPSLHVKIYRNLSPKFLIIAPGKRLSWQKHARRAELWRIIDGPVAIKLSDSDIEPEDTQKLNSNMIVEFDINIRHRLIGLDNWGVVAEIWKHSDSLHLSDESDIVRISDDFGR